VVLQRASKMLFPTRAVQKSEPRIARAGTPQDPARAATTGCNRESVDIDSRVLRPARVLDTPVEASAAKFFSYRE